MASLYGAKAWYSRKLSVFTRAAVDRSWSPDAFTVIGVAFALGTAAALLLGWWPLVLVGLAGRLAGANLDGAVARARGVSRPFGFVLNELGDRGSDLIVMAALSILAYRTGSLPLTTLWLVATLAASLPTFVSLAAAGAGAPRFNGGPFGKTERCLTVFLLAVALAIWPAIPTLMVGGTVMVAGSAATALWRIHLAHLKLSA